MAAKRPFRAGTRHRAALAAAVSAAALTASPALADVHVDPGGPAGKQYSAPLQQARQQASGREGASGTPGSSERAPLFGQGIAKGPGGGGPGGADGAGSSSSSGAAPELGSSGDSHVIWVAGAALLVLAVGGGVGMGLRSAAS